MSRPVFQPQYNLSVQFDGDALEVSGYPKPVTLPGDLTPEGTEAAIRRAVEIANTLTIGEDMWVDEERKSITVYVNHCRSFGMSNLLACVTRRYDFDAAVDVTEIRPHCGRVSYDTIDAIAAEMGL